MGTNGVLDEPLGDLASTEIPERPTVGVSRADKARVFDEQLRLLKQEAMCGIRVEDELRVRQMLLEVERVVGVEDDVGLFFVDHHRHRKVSQTGAALASDCPPGERPQRNARRLT